MGSLRKLCFDKSVRRSSSRASPGRSPFSHRPLGPLLAVRECWPGGARRVPCGRSRPAACSPST
eukprot:6908135-Alexandrium_andersonii.AAC.1